MKSCKNKGSIGRPGTQIAEHWVGIEHGKNSGFNLRRSTAGLSSLHSSGAPSITEPPGSRNLKSLPNLLIARGPFAFPMNQKVRMKTSYSKNNPTSK